MKNGKIDKGLHWRQQRLKKSERGGTRPNSMMRDHSYINDDEPMRHPINMGSRRGYETLILHFFADGE